MAGTIITSENRVEKRQLTWCVTNFARIQTVKEIVDKQEMPFEMGGEVGVQAKWKAFLLADQNQRGKNRGWIGLYVKPVDAPLEACNIFFAISVRVLNKNGGTFTNCRSNDMFNMADSKQGKGFSRVIPQDEDAAKLVDKEGTLTMIITVNVVNKEIDPVIRIEPEKPKLDFELDVNLIEGLRRDMCTFSENLSKEENPGTKIISSDGVTFPVSRRILQARSPVFKAMFSVGTKEEITGLVTLGDMSSKGLRILLYYIHTGVLKREWRQAEVVEEVIYAAHKYLLKDLMEYLDQNLVSVCTPRSCGGLLRVAAQLEMKQAKSDVFEYCKDIFLDMNPDQFVKFQEESKLSLVDLQEKFKPSGIVRDLRIIWWCTLGILFSCIVVWSVGGIWREEGASKN